MVLLPNNVPKISGYLFKYQIKFYLDKRLAGKGAKAADSSIIVPLTRLFVRTQTAA
jgi:hypothetical protein